MMNKRLCKFNALLFMIIFLSLTFFTTFGVKNISGKSLNSYPMVFVNGIYGWSKEEIEKRSYWGGSLDIIERLNNEGFKALSATVGNFSSNWDRAVELYYYIKGGRVDYGAAHAAKYGHERYGKIFPGIYPEWNEASKIHLIGHSYGGQTIRLLVELLRNGDKDEQDRYLADPSLGISPLFEGEKKWVESITTLGTPLNGSTFVNYASKNNKKLYLGLGGFPSLYNSNPKYDFKISQWGIKREEDESIYDYYERVQKNPIWDSEDNALGVLTTKGAEEFNNKTKAYQDMYYFSYSGNNSFRDMLTGYYLPKEIIWTPSAYITGRYTQNNTLPFGDRSWWKNDGAVSVISAQYPFKQPHRNYVGEAKRGVWNVNPTMENWPQEDFIGLQVRQNLYEVMKFYRKLANNLSTLPR